MTDFYGPNGGHREVFEILVIFFSVVSCLASILNILVIVRMEKYTGHVLVLLTMTTCQLIYDFSFYPGVINVPEEGIVVTANVLQLIGGLGSSLYSNFMSYVVFYVIWKRSMFDVFYYFKPFSVFCVIFVLIEIALYLMAVGNEEKYQHLSDIALLGVYYYFRLVSILFNLICCSISYYHVRKMRDENFYRSSDADKAIYTLTTRMHYYPLVQLVSRSGLAWYEFVYEWNFDPDTVSRSQFALQCFCAIITPTAAIGYLVVFLVMQPQGFKEFLYLLRLKDKKENLIAVTEKSDFYRVEMAESGDNPIQRHSLYNTTIVNDDRFSVDMTSAQERYSIEDQRGVQDQNIRESIRMSSTVTAVTSSSYDNKSFDTASGRGDSVVQAPSSEKSSLNLSTSDASIVSDYYRNHRLSSDMSRPSKQALSADMEMSSGGAPASNQNSLYAVDSKPVGLGLGLGLQAKPVSTANNPTTINHKTNHMNFCTDDELLEIIQKAKSSSNKAREEA